MLSIAFCPHEHWPSFQSLQSAFSKHLINYNITHLFHLVAQSHETKINRGYLLFEVNTKYISSSVLKTSEFSPMRSTSENFDVFNS